MQQLTATNRPATLPRVRTGCGCADGSGIGGFFAPDDKYVPCEGCGERVQVNCDASCGRCCHTCHREMPC